MKLDSLSEISRHQNLKGKILNTCCNKQQNTLLFILILTLAFEHSCTFACWERLLFLGWANTRKDSMQHVSFIFQRNLLSFLERHLNSWYIHNNTILFIIAYFLFCLVIWYLNNEYVNRPNSRFMAQDRSVTSQLP